MTGTELFHYTQCGLDDVWLANGFRIDETEYGEGFAIERADALHGAIALSIVNDGRPLRGQEARFLRTMLNLSQEAMAKALGVDRATIIRWERARDRALATMQDIAVRTTFAARSDGDGFLWNAIREERRRQDAWRGLPAGLRSQQERLAREEGGLNRRDYLYWASELEQG